MPPITPTPSICPPCPWRINVTPTPDRLAVVDTAERTSTPQACVLPRHEGLTCVAWLARCGPDNAAVVAAVGSGELRVADLAPGPRWPALHPSTAAVRAAVYDPAGRVDPLVVALREAREEADLSQVDVASRLGVNEATVRDWETGRVVPNLARLRAYADVCGVDLVVRKR